MSMAWDGGRSLLPSPLPGLPHFLRWLLSDPIVVVGAIDAMVLDQWNGHGVHQSLQLSGRVGETSERMELMEVGR